MNIDQGLQSSVDLKSDKDLLNNYIYDYLIKQNLSESAKIFSREADISSGQVGMSFVVILSSIHWF